MRWLSALVLFGGALPAYGWGTLGHSLVARIAWSQLPPAVQSQITALLDSGESLPSIASWADQVRNSRRETAKWHYIDIPISRPALDMARDCPGGDCIIAAIARFREVLVNPSATRAQRREALLFVVHFIGDMHQPLHCVDDGDNGGNQVQVTLFGDRSNLHRVWDSGLLARMGTEDELFARLSKAVTPETAAEWSRGAVEDWAEEGHQIAKRVCYGRLPGIPKTEPSPLAEAYEQAAGPVIEQQIEKAGVRLASVLNAAFAREARIP